MGLFDDIGDAVGDAVDSITGGDSNDSTDAGSGVTGDSGRDTRYGGGGSDTTAGSGSTGDYSDNDFGSGGGWSGDTDYGGTSSVGTSGFGGSSGGPDDDDDDWSRGGGDARLGTVADQQDSGTSGDSSGGDSGGFFDDVGNAVDEGLGGVDEAVGEAVDDFTGGGDSKDSGTSGGGGPSGGSTGGGVSDGDSASDSGDSSGDFVDDVRDWADRSLGSTDEMVAREVEKATAEGRAAQEDSFFDGLTEAAGQAQAGIDQGLGPMDEAVGQGVDAYTDFVEAERAALYGNPERSTEKLRSATEKAAGAADTAAGGTDEYVGRAEKNRDIAGDLTRQGGLFPEGVETTELDRPSQQLEGPENVPRDISNPEEFIAGEVARRNPGVDAEDVSVERQDGQSTTDVNLERQDVRERIAANNPGVSPEDVTFTNRDGEVVPVERQINEQAGPLGISERDLKNAAGTYREFATGVSEGVSLPVNLVESGYQAYQGKDPHKEGPAERFTEGAITTGAGLLNIPSWVQKGETAYEVSKNAPGAVDEYGGAAVAETATAIARNEGEDIARYAGENPYRFAGSLVGGYVSGRVAGRYSPVKYQKADVLDADAPEGVGTYRGVTVDTPGKSRPVAGVYRGSPTLGSPEVELKGPSMAPNTAGSAPETPVETTIWEKNLRSQLEGEDLARFEASRELSRLGRKSRTERVFEQITGRRSTGATLEEGIRQSQQIPDEAAPEVADWIRENDAMFGGSAAQLMQAGEARVPDDIDIYTRTPEQARQDLMDILGEYESRNMKEGKAGRIEVHQGGGEYDHMVDINELERGTTGVKNWGGRLYGSERAGAGGRIQPLESQLNAKLEGAVRLFEEGTIAPKTWRAKDVRDVENVARGLIEENRQSLNPLARYRARRAEDALEQWRDAFGTLDLPEQSFDDWQDLASAFDTAEMDVAGRPGRGFPEIGRPTAGSPFAQFLADERGQVGLGGRRITGDSDRATRSDTEADSRRRSGQYGEEEIPNDSELPGDWKGEVPDEPGTVARFYKEGDSSRPRGSDREYEYPRDSGEPQRYGPPAYSGDAYDEYVDRIRDYVGNNIYDGPRITGDQDYAPPSGREREYTPPAGGGEQDYGQPTSGEEYTPPTGTTDGGGGGGGTYGPPGFQTSYGPPQMVTQQTTYTVPYNPILTTPGPGPLEGRSRPERRGDEQEQWEPQRMPFGFWNQAWVNPVASAQTAWERTLGGGGQPQAGLDADGMLDAVEEDLQRYQ